MTVHLYTIEFFTRPPALSLVLKIQHFMKHRNTLTPWVLHFNVVGFLLPGAVLHIPLKCFSFFKVSPKCPRLRRPFELINNVG